MKSYASDLYYRTIFVVPHEFVYVTITITITEISKKVLSRTISIHTNRGRSKYYLPSPSSHEQMLHHKVQKYLGSSRE